MWREYLTPIGETIERARLFERMLTALDPAELEAVAGRLRHLDVPVLLVWGTAEEALGVEWAYRLRDLIPGAREVVEIDGRQTLLPRGAARETGRPAAPPLGTLTTTSS